MAVTPESFIRSVKDRPISELISIRRALIEELDRYELHRDSFSLGECMTLPTPDDQYLLNCEYMYRLSELIFEKAKAVSTINQMINGHESPTADLWSAMGIYFHDVEYMYTRDELQKMIISMNAKTRYADEKLNGCFNAYKADALFLNTRETLFKQYMRK